MMDWILCDGIAENRSIGMKSKNHTASPEDTIQNALETPGGPLGVVERLRIVLRPIPKRTKSCKSRSIIRLVTQTEESTFVEKPPYIIAHEETSRSKGKIALSFQINPAATLNSILPGLSRLCWSIGFVAS